jgi:L-amino acid N-acyltransferase YncA
LARLRAVVTELGVVDAVWYGVRRALARSGGRLALIKYYLVAQPIAAAPRVPERLARSIVRRPVVAGEAVLAQFPVPAQVIHARFAQGARCLGAFKDRELVAYAWWMEGPYDEDEVRTRFVPLPAAHSAWDFDVYVDPRHRLGLAFARLWDELSGRLRAQGVRWTMSRISAFNTASLAAHRRLGARVVASVTYLVLGSCQLTFSTTRPYLHVSTGPGSVPQLRVHAPQ